MSLLSLPQVREMMNDPAKMEASLETMRTSLLSALNEMENGDNVMVRMMLEQMKGQVGEVFPGGWEGLRELIEDPEKWRMLMGGMMDAMRSLGEVVDRCVDATSGSSHSSCENRRHNPPHKGLRPGTVTTNTG